MKQFCCFLLLSAAVAGTAGAQNERAVIPFSDPAAPKRLQVNLLHGSIAITGYGGKEVIIESKPSGSSRQRRREPPPGMRRLENNSAGITAEESGNLVKVTAPPAGNINELAIQVPVDTSVKLNTVNGRVISVEGISGEIDAQSTNGGISITNVSGAVVAHALNGKVVVVLNEVTSGKAMSFSSFNGTVDVTLPASVKANLKMKSDTGDIFTDFEIQLKPSSGQTIASGASGQGKYRLRFDRALYGTINGGGPEFSFTTFNGTIYIRQKK
jgi:hypothetical protein